MLEITIIPEDFKNAPRGYNHPECVLEVALKRIFPTKYVFVRAFTLTIDNRNYRIDLGEWGNGNNPGGFSHNAINELSQLAKESLDGIPTKTLYLQPLETRVVVLPGLNDPIIT